MITNDSAFRNAAFEEWRLKLQRGDRLPRGRYFVGKKPGWRSMIVLDECWRGESSEVIKVVIQNANARLASS